ncbi:MAG: hypothetical protein KAS39_04305 [Actinomycetia bacterium]|nr:hypothetical protein [Actinomycetes bacterium]
MKKKLIVLSLVIVFVFLISGCASFAQKAVEKEIEKSTGAEVDIDEGKIKVKTDEGEAEMEVGEAASLPDDFPDDFPLYEKAKLVSSFKMTEEEKESFQLSFEFDGDWKEVADFYQDSLPGSGYTIVSSMETMGGVTIIIKKGEEDAGAIFIGEADGKGMMTVTLVL